MHGIVDTILFMAHYIFVPPLVLNAWSERVGEEGRISPDKIQLSDDDSSYLYIFLLLFYIFFCFVHVSDLQQKILSKIIFVYEILGIQHLKFFWRDSVEIG